MAISVGNKKTSINVRPFCLSHSSKSSALDSSDMGGEDLSIQFHDKTIDLKSPPIFVFHLTRKAGDSNKPQRPSSATDKHVLGWKEYFVGRKSCFWVFKVF